MAINKIDNPIAYAEMLHEVYAPQTPCTLSVQELQSKIEEIKDQMQKERKNEFWLQLSGYLMSYNILLELKML